MRVLVVVGARPNFMKAAPLVGALTDVGIDTFLVHTGQHFDDNMSKAFFEVLNLPEPDIHLNVGGRSRADQFAEVVAGIARSIGRLRPQRLLVVGDVTSTAAAAVAADTCNLPVDHVEAGLRSFDLEMPEERNRMIADTVSDLLFATEPAGVQNLQREGKSEDKIHLVGNVMIDTLDRMLAPALEGEPWRAFGLEPREYVVVTAHRPSNVDDDSGISRLLDILGLCDENDLTAIIPGHPRTEARFHSLGTKAKVASRLRIVDPLDYLTFIGLVARARAVITDSGGLQEETTTLGIPCLTLRENTERPATLLQNGGSSVLVGLNVELGRERFRELLSLERPVGTRPSFWDGQAADKIAKILSSIDTR
jgi:UDP-N-acetylglucosamine 2-epimerase (non-hydrolysing)